jgi:hypothetical protein
MMLKRPKEEGKAIDDQARAKSLEPVNGTLLGRGWFRGRSQASKGPVVLADRCNQIDTSPVNYLAAR